VGRRIRPVAIAGGLAVVCLLGPAAATAATTLLPAMSSGAGDYVYWVAQAGSVGRAGTDGSGLEGSFVHLGVLSYPCGVAVAGAYLYWAEDGTGSIWRANLDGEGAKQIVSGASRGACGVSVSGAYLYWANGTTIGRASLDGSGAEESFVPNAGTGANAVAVTGQYIYWTESGSPNPGGSAMGAIGRAALDGSGANPSFISRAGTDADGLAVSGGELYWGWSDQNDADDSWIAKAALDGSAPQEQFIHVVTTVETAVVSGVAVYGGYVYWGDNQFQSIGRAALDGSGASDHFLTGTGQVTGIAVGPGEGGSGSSSGGGGGGSGGSGGEGTSPSGANYVKPTVDKPGLVELEFPGVAPWTVPAGVHEVTVVAVGATGGDGVEHYVPHPAVADNAGHGGEVTATVTVYPGENLQLVAGKPGHAGDPKGGPVKGGFPDGGGATGGGGGGGGWSGLCPQGWASVSDCLAVAPGGGGGGGASSLGSGGGSGGTYGRDGGQGTSGSSTAGGAGGGAGGGGDNPAGGKGGAGAFSGDNGVDGTNDQGGAGGQGGQSAGGGGGGGGGWPGGGGGGGGGWGGPTNGKFGGGGGGGSGRIGARAIGVAVGRAGGDIPLVKVAYRVGG